MKLTKIAATAATAILLANGCAMAQPRDVENAMVQPIPELTMGGLGATSGGCLNVTVINPGTHMLERYTLFSNNPQAFDLASQIITHPPFGTFSFNKGPLAVGCAEPSNHTIVNLTGP